MDILIRPATLADADAVAAFNQALAWESEGKRLDPGVLAAGVRAVLADRHKGFYTVAERAGEVVGQVLVTYEWTDWRNGWYWWVQSVYVRADARRGGVFTALYRHLEAAALADPTVVGLRLYVERDNAPAQQVYRRLGLADEPYFVMGRYPLPGRAEHVWGPSPGEDENQ
jgi:ribosomal protein S18 acetylase RimI-like enzyme